MKDFEEENVDNYEILNIVNEIKIIIKGDRYNNDSIMDFKKDILGEIEKVEEALLSSLGDNDLKISKPEFADSNWKYLIEKKAYPFEIFNVIDDSQKPVDILKKEDFFSNIKNEYPSDEGIERTKEKIKLFDVKNGEELTHLYLKSYVL